MSFKEMIKDNKYLHYLGICLKKMKDDDFRYKVMNLYSKPNALFFHHMGTANADKNIYLIYSNNAARGFFSQFNLVLDGLYFADYYHLTPVVEFGPNTLHHEENGLNGMVNSFEYYFQQPASVSAAEARISQNVVFYEYSHREISVSNFNSTLAKSLDNPEEMEAYMDSKSSLIRKYIRFSDGVQNYLDETVEPLFAGFKVLGVHVRGTDFNAGYNGHAIAVAPEEYLKETENAFKSGKFDKVFLATDEAFVIRMYEEVFGDRLVYYEDVLRSEDGTALHFSKSSRKNHKYLLGLEVLRDMYSLSKCHGLIAGMSNVALAARMMKRSRGIDYDLLKVINRGFNVTNKRMKST